MFPCLYIFKKRKPEHLYWNKEGYFYENEHHQLLGENKVECVELGRDREGILPNRYGSF